MDLTDRHSVIQLITQRSSGVATLNDDQDGKKLCSDCKTTKTPLWRSGPAGPKSLCNACGIRHRKRRRAAMALESPADKKQSKQDQIVSSDECSSTSESTTTSTDTAKLSTAAGTTSTPTAPVRVRVVYAGNRGAMTIQKKSQSPSPHLPLPLIVMKKQRCQRRRKLAEEEQAAFCLMALSCGCVFA